MRTAVLYVSLCRFSVGPDFPKEFSAFISKCQGIQEELLCKGQFQFPVLHSTNMQVYYEYLKID